MSILTRSDVLLHCRTCLCNLKKCDKNANFKRYHLKTTQDLGNWIEEFTSLQVLADDEYPQYICEGCYSVFKTFHMFQQLVLQAADKLRTLLTKNETLVDDKDELDSNNSTLKQKLNSGLVVNNTIPSDHQNDTFHNANTGLSKTSERDAEQFKMEFESFDGEFITNDDEPVTYPKDDSFNKPVELVEKTKVHQILEADCLITNIRSFGNSIEDKQSKKNGNDNNYYEISSSDESPNEHCNNKQNAVLSNKCNLCQRVFPNENVLKKHLSKKHNESRPFVCQICNSRFVQKGTLKQHERIHTGERPYVCEICDHSFNQLSHLKNHKAVNHECSICKKKFQKRHILKFHIFKVHEVESKCEICEKVFTTKYAFKKHQSAVHKKRFTLNGTLKTQNKTRAGKKPSVAK